MTGDKAKLLVQVGTSMGCITATHEFLILDDDTEDMVMGVAWHKSIVGGVLGEGTRIVDLDTFGIALPNPLQNGSDDAPEDQLLEESTLDMFPEPSEENWQQCHFNPYFPQLDRLKDIVKEHGATLFQPFDTEGLRVEPLVIKV